ncbi:Protein phosphatase 2C 7 [Acorus gramineus]|uniref:protein-serine/threonine phosphatase n=1 Tax=Acorus gramineus TaxID=55184 RepID=A0AAV9A2Z9_ACOGR|nr:Protein phosphatase 2C 7 [Acorus gramineus]
MASNVRHGAHIDTLNHDHAWVQIRAIFQDGVTKSLRKHALSSRQLLVVKKDVQDSKGDRYLKPMIIPDPEVTFVPRMREDECLILASDGLWDVMSNEEACDVARKCILHWHKRNGVTPSVERGIGADPAAQAAADYLSKYAIQKGSKDNITVIVSPKIGDLLTGAIDNVTSHEVSSAAICLSNTLPSFEIYFVLQSKDA